MAGSNSNIQLTGLDFDEIKNNLKTYLKNQNVLKDANYEGSVLSILLDVLAYNTHYNAHYLNMVANEMFLDSCVKRASTISHAKVLGYLPNSFTAPTATISIYFSGVTASTIIIPKYTKFITDTINNVNYTYLTLDEYILTTDQTTQTASIDNIEIKQGEPLGFSFLYNEADNVNQKFKLPDANIDISTIQVLVQKSATDVRNTIYLYPRDMLALDSESEVYFIQETFDGYYEIYFGDGILGKKLQDGNVIHVSYLSVSKNIVQNISNFYLVSNLIGDYAEVNVVAEAASWGGGYKESINSIKNIAPKAYQAQERSVTVNDYMALIQKRCGEYPVDSVNVWSGEENSPPIYGRVFIAIKPRNTYLITNNQKNRIIADIIKPMNVITIEPVIVDVDYSYLNIEVNVTYNKNKTIKTTEALRTAIIAALRNYGNENLNTFNSTLIGSDLLQTVQNVDYSIITNEQYYKLEKRITPTLKTSQSYTFNFATPIKRDYERNSVSFYPSVQMIDTNLSKTLRSEVYIEEVPTSGTSIESIKIINPGYGYTDIPTITIIGDGEGAAAHAIVVDGRIERIILDNVGINYTQAIIEINGGNGVFGSAVATLQKQYGTLRTYYFNNGIKTIMSNNIGTVDYYNGIVTLTNFNPYNINNNLGILSIFVVPKSSIIESKREKMVTIDRNDNKAIKVNISKK